MHDTVTGRSASGIMEFLNQTPIDWFAKRQNQVESATYGSEFMVARQGTERICDLRYTLRAFGVPLEETAWMFGDNQSVVTSSTIPHSTLSKRWNALSYHKVREAVAAGWLRFEHIPGTQNMADIFTKPLPWATMRDHVEPVLFWKGETQVDNAGATHGHNTEGSVASPSHDVTRDSNESATDGFVPVRAARGTNQMMRFDYSTIRMDGAYGVVGDLQTAVQARDVLWNNQYSILNDGDGESETDIGYRNSEEPSSDDHNFFV